MVKREIVKNLGRVEYIVLSHKGQDFAFDIETSGLDPHKDRILGLSLCFQDGSNYYITNEHTIEENPRTEEGPNTRVYIPVQDMIRVVQPLFLQEDVWMVAHNLAFDYKFLTLAGLKIEGRLYDTMLGAKILDDSSKSLGLKDLSMRVLGIQMNHYQNLTHFEGFGKDEFLAVPLQEAAEYALHDTEVTWKLFVNQHPKIVEEQLDKSFFRIWMKLTPILAEMGLKGIALDIEGLKEFEAEVSERLEEIEGRIFSAGIGMVLSQDPPPPNYIKMVHHIDAEWEDDGGDTFIYKGFNLPIFREGRKKPRTCTFNPSSTQQLGELLYGHLGLELPAGIFLKSNKSGKSTDYDTLQVLMHSYGEDAPSILQDIVEQKKLSKLRSAFLIPLQEWADPNDHNCIRTNFNQHVTDTFRLSSSQPNMQQIPSRGDIGARMRSLFIARPNHKLVVADFSNMELRVIAHYSNDEVYRDAFAHGEDLHAKTASTQFGVPYEDIVEGVEKGETKYKQYRAIGKTANFALSYGMGAKAFKTRLLVDSGITVDLDESQRLIDGYRSTYPQAEEWKAKVTERAYELGYVRSISGAKRRLPDLYSNDKGEVMRAERQATNFCVQSSSASITGMALIKMAELLKPLGAYPLLQVHDEIVVEAPEATAKEAAKVMEYCMGEYVNEVFKLRVPMDAEAGIGDNWGEAK